ncbi:MAG: DUF4160 domain-containing protein [Bdellovibrionia bacterium]
MSVVLRFEGIVFVIWTREPTSEPPHIHAYYPRFKDHEASAKVRIDTLGIMEHDGFSKADLKMIQEKVSEHRDRLMEKWEEYHEEI